MTIVIVVRHCRGTTALPSTRAIVRRSIGQDNNRHRGGKMLLGIDVSVQ